MLDGKKIVVTGAASGIGKKTAEELKKQGAYVIGVDRNPTQEVDEFHQVDLMDKGAIDKLIQNLPNEIDGLANIAGLPPTAPANIVVTVNLVALKYLTLSLISKMKDGASIVNLASLAGLGWRESKNSIKASEKLDFDSVEEFNKTYEIVGPRSYFFSKEALIVWTMENRWTWRDRGIRMNCVSPGPVETPILKDFIDSLGERAEEDMKIMDRAGNPSDIAPIVAFMLSDSTVWVRGANIPVDGGMHQHVLLAKNGFLG